MDTTPDYLISTPENVDLHLELAGIGNRVLAAFIDHVTIGATMLLIILAGLGVGWAIEQTHGLETSVKTVIYYYLVGITVFLLFGTMFGYFILFEGFWQGQTPGKRLAGIRVIESNGQPVGWPGVFIRNLLRIIDEIAYLGVIPMLIDRNERRLGDLAAGTLVIKERVPALSASTLRIMSPPSEELPVDTGQISPDEYDLLVSFLRRREIMSKNQRQRLAANIATHFRKKLNLDDTEAPEPTIEKLYIAYKSKAELAAD